MSREKNCGKNPFRTTRQTGQSLCQNGYRVVPILAQNLAHFHGSNLIVKPNGYANLRQREELGLFCRPLERLGDYRD